MNKDTSDSLVEGLHQLRKSFHLNLSKRRGLLISEKDLTRSRRLGDLELQRHLERMSTFRKPFSDLKRKIRLAYHLALRRA